MKCCVCKRNIASGVDAQKMIVEYQQPDGTIKVFGYQMPDGSLSEATGFILRAYHHKHFHIVRKREGRGDAVTGRVLNGVPTGYQIESMILSREEFEALGITEDEAREQGTAYLSERIDRLRECARRIGKGVGDGTVLEAFWAEERGGPYRHTHHLRLEVYQLRAHLRFAHGIEQDPRTIKRNDIHDIHAAIHADEAQAATAAERQADPGYQEPAEANWRDAVEVEAGELT